jgi:predicted nucleic acid-binding Zn ribbon protein
MRTCEACGISIEGKRLNAVTCSNICRLRKKRKVDGTVTTLHTITCVSCSEEFSTAHANATTCSDACRKRKQRNNEQSDQQRVTVQKPRSSWSTHPRKYDILEKAAMWKEYGCKKLQIDANQHSCKELMADNMINALHDTQLFGPNSPVRREVLNILTKDINQH